MTGIEKTVEEEEFGSPESVIIVDGEGFGSLERLNFVVYQGFLSLRDRISSTLRIFSSQRSQSARRRGFLMFGIEKMDDSEGFWSHTRVKIVDGEEMGSSRK